MLLSTFIEMRPNLTWQIFREDGKERCNIFILTFMIEIDCFYFCQPNLNENIFNVRLTYPFFFTILLFISFLMNKSTTELDYSIIT